MFKKVVLLVAAVGVRAGAQADSVKPSFTVGAAHMVAGFANFGFAELDARIAAAGLPAVAHAAASAGIDSDVRVGRFLFGAGFQALITRDQTDDAHRTRLSGSYAMVDAGVAPLMRNGWSIYPIVGIGAANINVNLRELGRFTFDEGLARPTREVGMSGLTGMTHAGVMIERRLRRGKAEFALALRGGVMRSFGSQAWTSDANKVDGGPAGLRGSYLRLMLSRPIKTRRDALLPAAGAVLQTVVR